MSKIYISLLRHLVIFSILFSLTLSLPAQKLLDPGTQPKFVNHLPVPAVIDGRNGGVYTIGMTQFDQWLGLRNPVTRQPLSTTVWGYNNTYPGPTILAKRDVPIDIFWQNNLINGSGQPLPHLLPVDPSIYWALSDKPGWQQYGIPTVTHLHGGHTESASDGLPDAWFTPNFTMKGHGFVKGDVEPYHYSNEQEAATIWYHDHALGITRLNVYAGLAGYYLITDNNEMNLQNTGKLPAIPYDLGLAIQDKMFTEEGQLYYPSMPESAGHPDPSILPEFFGDFILVNGMTWPVLEVEPRQYRFRVLNGSDSRFYNIFLSSPIVIQQIGTDNGLLPSPVPLTKLLIGPGERKDIVLDFSDPALVGQMIIMRNNAKTPFPKGSAVDPQTTGQIMAFRVSKPLDPAFPPTELPSSLRPPITPLHTTLPARKLILFEGLDEYGRLKPMLGTVDKGILGMHDPVTENPIYNSTEIWEVYNETEDAHPIHLHMVTMQLISRQKFTAVIDPENGKTSDIRMIGLPRAPDPEEKGWKDTWVMYPGEVTRVIAKFDMKGLYVWHCHILSHEDHEMMRPYFVGEMDQQEEMKTPVKIPGTSLEKQVQLQTIPNPFSHQFSIVFNVPETGMIHVNVYNANGVLLRKVQQGMMRKGMQQFQVDGSKWTNGVYYVEVTIGQQRFLRKMILQK